MSFCVGYVYKREVLILVKLAIGIVICLLMRQVIILFISVGKLPDDICLVNIKVSFFSNYIKRLDAYWQSSIVCLYHNSCLYMNFSAKLRFNFHISKRFRGKVTEIVVDSLAARIFTESSRQKKTVLLQNGETSTLQMQHKMTQIEHNLLFVKYQRKSKIFYKKQPKRCRIPTNATPF